MQIKEEDYAYTVWLYPEALKEAAAVRKADESKNKKTIFFISGDKDLASSMEQLVARHVICRS